MMGKFSVEVIQLEPLAVRPKEAAKLIGVSLRKFHSMRACGQLPPAIKCGGCLLYRVDFLRRFVELGFPSLEKFLALVAVPEPVYRRLEDAGKKNYIGGSFECSVFVPGASEYCLCTGRD